jgi:hypothetical protein
MRAQLRTRITFKPFASFSWLKSSKRAFSVSQRQQATWGFIGLGQMGKRSTNASFIYGTALLIYQLGYPMAKNLRLKLPNDDILFVQDINQKATESFSQESPEGVIIAETPREVAEKAVCCIRFPCAHLICIYTMMRDLFPIK